MTHVFMIIDRYHPIWGGAENQLAGLAEKLPTHEVRVTILTRRWNPDLAKKDSLNGVSVLRTGIPGPPGLWTNLCYVVGVLIQLLRHRKDIDVIHTHGAVLLGGLGKMAGILLRKPNVVKIATAGKVGTIQNTWWGRKYLSLLKRSSRVIALSEEIQSELNRIGLTEDTISRIPNGVNTDAFHPSRKNRLAVREEKGLGQEDVVILFAGRLVYRKGLDLLLKSWESISSRYPTVHLWILGSGSNQPDSMEQEWRQQVQKMRLPRVTWLGESSDPARVYQAADILAFPSRQEGLSNTLLEAMACGLCPVASQIGGTTDLMDHGESGLFFPPDDAMALTEQLSTVLENPRLRETLAQAAREKVTRQFELDRIAGRYAKLYRELKNPGNRAVFLGTYSLHPRQKLLLESLRRDPDWGVQECRFNPWGDASDKTRIQGTGRRLQIAARFFVAYPFLVFRYLLLPRHDIVVMMHPGLLDIVLLGGWVKLRRKPLFWDVYISLYDTLVNDRRLLNRTGRMANLLRLLERTAIRLADVPFLDTREHADYLETLYALPPKSIQVVHVGVDSAFLRHLHAAEPPPSPKHDGPVQLLFYGNYIPLHGIQTMVEATARLKETDKAFHLTLVGTGQTAADVDRQIEDLGLQNVTRIPWLDYPELVNAILRSDICLGIFGTSDKARRVIPNKVYQLAAAGVPFVTAETPGLAEFLALTDHPLPCTTVPPGDPEALADAILSLSNRLSQTSHVGFAFDVERVHHEFTDLLSIKLTRPPQV